MSRYFTLGLDRAEAASLAPPDWDALRSMFRTWGESGRPFGSQSQHRSGNIQTESVIHDDAAFTGFRGRFPFCISAKAAESVYAEGDITRQDLCGN